MDECTHLDQIKQVTPSARGCEDCLKTGDTLNKQVCRHMEVIR